MELTLCQSGARWALNLPYFRLELQIPAKALGGFPIDRVLKELVRYQSRNCGPHNYSAGGCSSAGVSGGGAFSAGDCGAFSAGDCGAGFTT